MPLVHTDAQVLPRGVAMFATRQHGTSGTKEQTRTYDTHAANVRTVYLDVLLLGIAQREWLSRLLVDAARLGDDPANHPRAVDDLQRELRRFQNTWWWTEVLPAWRHPDRLLEAFQRVTGTPEALRVAREDLALFATEIEARAARRTNLFVALIAVIGLPGVVASVLQALDTDGDTAAAWLVGSGAAAVILGLVFAVFLGYVQLPRRRGDPSG